MIADDKKKKLKKIFVKAALTAALFGSPAATGCKSEASSETNDKDKKEIVIESKKQFVYDKVKLEEYKDIETLFDKALPIIFTELCLEENFRLDAYDDGQKYAGHINTVGLGSTFRPINIKDYNNPDAVWYKIWRHENLATDISAEETLFLIIGWAKYRQKTEDDNGKIRNSKTILQRMFENLKGTELSTNEFSALFCACYNQETNINGICVFVCNNHENQQKCANEIARWFSDKVSDKGNSKRAVCEAYVYLNAEDFCEAMLDMPFSRGGTCIYAEEVTMPLFDAKNYTELTKKIKTIYFGTKKLYENPKTPRSCMAESIKKHFKPGTLNIKSEKKQKKAPKPSYKKALKEMRLGNNEAALLILLDLQKDEYKSAKLYNDIAYIYRQKGNYNKCIEYCKKVLGTKNHGEYARACYEAGLAYEAKGDYEGAVRNFNSAIAHYDKYGINNPDTDVEYREMYKKALEKANTKKIANKKSTQKSNSL